MTLTEVLLVSRDRYNVFQQAIEEANPAIVQVSDRFHLTKNLWELLDKVLLKALPTKIRRTPLNDDGAIQTEPTERQLPMSANEKKSVENGQKKWALALRIKELRNQGLSYLKLADVFHLDRRTVKKYCEMNGPMDQKHRYRTSPVDPFVDHIKHCVHLGKTVKRMVKELRDMGYKGTYSAVRIRVQDLRRDAKYGVRKKETTFSRKHIRYLFWLPFEELESEEKEILDDALSQYPDTQELYGFVQLFRDMIHFRDLETFYFLLNSKENYQSKSIRLFIGKLQEDPQSIHNALVYTYNNGLLEGHVNRLKLIKRLTYGRASFTLLRQRVLFGA
ncbi:transposase [Sporolactobacillus terrae]|uniref:transposase n=1 Tax=Sporolactobacillus terrae TaxID=269673 RepID=UPI001562DB40|nr:transposase [Sporolactobacillus terrae]